MSQRACLTFFPGVSRAKNSEEDIDSITGVVLAPKDPT